MNENINFFAASIIYSCGLVEVKIYFISQGVKLFLTAKSIHLESKKFLSIKTLKNGEGE